MSPHGYSLLGILLAASISPSCGAGDTCPTGQTSLQLSIGVQDATARGQIQSMWVELTIDGTRSRKLFTPGRALDEGRYPITVVIDSPIAMNTPVGIAVRGNDASDGSGMVVAQDVELMPIVLDTCNRANIDLQPIGAAGPTRNPPANPPSPTPRNADDCPSHPDSSTIAFYDFENIGGGTLVNQLAVQLDGRLLGSGFNAVPGPNGCGNALAFPTNNPGGASFGTIPDRSVPGTRGRNAFSLAAGSFDLWINAPDGRPYANRFTVVSRDSPGLDTGVALMIACDGTLVVRIGRVGGTQFHQCSNEAIQPGTWHRVAVSFGDPGLELEVDGETQDRGGSLLLGGAGCTIPVTCGTSTTTGMDVGSSPWTLGTDGLGAADAPFLGGAIDELRIRSGRHQE